MQRRASCKTVWDDIPILRSGSQRKRFGYPTQKPEALLDRILRASSNDNDLILDCFCGSGTTPAVAEKLGRRWIACDLGRFAIHTTRKRLLNIEGVKPFLVQNLGKYERQLWQTGAFAADGPRDAGTGGDSASASTPTSSSASTTPRRCPAGRCCTASRTAGSSTSAASRRR